MYVKADQACYVKKCIYCSLVAVCRDIEAYVHVCGSKLGCCRYELQVALCLESEVLLGSDRELSAMEATVTKVPSVRDEECV